MIVFISDAHLTSQKPNSRTDNPLETSLKKFDEILQFTWSTQSILISAGDLFHRPRDWHLIPDIIRLLKKYEIPFYAVFGQHDAYMYNFEAAKKTNLGILESAGLVKILSDQVILHDDLALFGINWGMEHNLERMNEEAYTLLENHATILSAHISIAENPLFPGHKITKPKKFLAKATNFQYIHVGDIHKKWEVHVEDSRKIFNPGPLMRLEASNDMMAHEPGFYFLESSGKLIFKKLECAKPSMEVLTREFIEISSDQRRVLDEFVSAVDSEQIRSVNVVENVQRWCRENKVPEPVTKILSEMMLDA